MYRRIGRSAALGAALTLLVGIGVASAHEQRDVGDYTFTVGLLQEPERVRVKGKQAELEYNSALFALLRQKRKELYRTDLPDRNKETDSPKCSK